MNNYEKLGQMNDAERESSLASGTASSREAADIAKAGHALRIKALEDALRMLITAYVATLEGGRDRILFLGGTCDDVPTMEAGDPALRHAKHVLTPAQRSGDDNG